MQDLSGSETQSIEPTVPLVPGLMEQETHPQSKKKRGKRGAGDFSRYPSEILDDLREREDETRKM